MKLKMSTMMNLHRRIRIKKFLMKQCTSLKLRLKIKNHFWRRKIVITIAQDDRTDKKKKKEENSFFNCFKIGSSDVIKISLGMLLAMTLIRMSAADPNFYRASAKKTEFCDV